MRYACNKPRTSIVLWILESAPTKKAINLVLGLGGIMPDQVVFFHHDLSRLRRNSSCRLAVFHHTRFKAFLRLLFGQVFLKRRVCEIL